MTKRQNRTKQADILFSRQVRAIGRCENCGDTTGLQCAHGFSRRYRNTRWVKTNAWCLCKGCHLKYTMRPLEWDDWMIDRLGPDTYLELRRLALSTTKVDLAAIIDELRATEPDASPAG